MGSNSDCAVGSFFGNGGSLSSIKEREGKIRKHEKEGSPYDAYHLRKKPPVDQE